MSRLFQGVVVGGQFDYRYLEIMTIGLMLEASCISEKWTVANVLLHSWRMRVANAGWMTTVKLHLRFQKGATHVGIKPRKHAVFPWKPLLLLVSKADINKTIY